MIYIKKKGKKKRKTRVYMENKNGKIKIVPFSCIKICKFEYEMEYKKIATVTEVTCFRQRDKLVTCKNMFTALPNVEQP